MFMEKSSLNSLILSRKRMEYNLRWKEVPEFPDHRKHRIFCRDPHRDFAVLPQERGPIFLRSRCSIGNEILLVEPHCTCERRRGREDVSTLLESVSLVSLNLEQPPIHLIFSFFSFFFGFLGLHPWHMEVPSLEVESECSCRPAPQLMAMLDP